MSTQSSQLSLSSREREILKKICEGETYSTIARVLGISTHTVDTHIRRIRRKTGIANRSQLVILAVRLGLYQADQ
ncbi:helix-turn-helix transcriptional regulator [Streptomyces sp. MI02-7b]|uniref:response regulator transcription factor n=1 Tax=Streptomyces sp. MI02-7b TaxID=462941 RepID=UPI0029A75933|nr:helix-turn-helix transcriptional regulator [Streptomyces sp. MI02-7b]MDX3078415.1 helix-turn-helix transcriptional regulator [Streptomyces sp. MI02-7b]